MADQRSTARTQLSYDAFRAAAPAAHAALLALGKAVHDAGFDARLSEIVKIRVSQLNGCTFCVVYHLDAARRLGIDAATLDQIAAWHDSPAFDARDRAALAWAEHLTILASVPPSSRSDPPSLALFGPEEVINLAVVIATINAWNRIAGGLHFPPPARAA